MTNSPKKVGKVQRDDPEQSALFICVARELGADKESDAADRLMGILRSKPPEPHPKPKKKRRKK